MNFYDHITDKKWRAVIFREDIDWKFMANTVGAIKNPKYHKILSRITVIMMVVNDSSLNVRDCEHESFPSCQNNGRKHIKNVQFSPEKNPSNMNVIKTERKRMHFQQEESNVTFPTGKKIVEVGTVNENADFATVVAKKILQMSIALKLTEDIKDF